MKIKKLCRFCDSEYDDQNDFSYILKNGNDVCPNCIEINKLKELLKKYSDSQSDKEWDSSIHKKNMIEDNIDYGNGVKSYTSLHYSSSFRFENRCKTINELIERIDYARRLLAVEIAGQFEILDSIYEKKNVFWEESGNFLRYVHNASFEYVVIKLKELLSGFNSKYSILKIKNLLVNNKSNINNQKIYEVFTYDNGDQFEIKFDVFPMLDYLNKIDGLIEMYKETINAISDFRDNYFAHISSLKDEASSKNLSYVNIKRIFNMLKLIYDGLLYAVAPDKYTNLIVDHNIYISHLDNIIKEYRKNRKND